MAKSDIFSLEALKATEIKVDPKAKYIKFEGDNSNFCWRVVGDIMNPEAEVIVPLTHNCVFIKDGAPVGVLSAGRYPIFDTEKKRHFIFTRKEKKGAISVDIVFFNKTTMVQVPWGTRTPIDSHDPVTNIPVHVGANGEYAINVADPLAFYTKIIGADKAFTMESLKARLDKQVDALIRPTIAQFVHDKQLPYSHLSDHTAELAGVVGPQVVEKMKEYGLACNDFIISGIMVPEAEKHAIEAAIQSEALEIKNKKDAKELAAELERIEDKDWERQMELRKIAEADRDKYYEVLKILGWPDELHGAGGKANEKGGHFCPNCGHSYEVGALFCGNCGAPLPGGKVKCPKCGLENDSDAKFCSRCGSKLH